MKKVLSVILSLIMVLCAMPAGAAFASGQSTITPGQTVEVTIDYSGDQHFITFTPQKTGEYRIVSHLGDDIVTPWCFVLDSSGETIAEDMGGDDTEGQVNPNVDITAEFNAGEEYLIVCQSTAITEPVIYYVELIEVNPSEPEIPEVSAPVISAFDITETSFSIKWEPVNGATEYLIYDISKNPAVHIDTIKENQYTFSNCTPDTEYNIRVTAANSKYSAYADYSVTTLKEEPPQEKVEPPTGFNVYARGDGGTDLYLDWDDVAGADGYRVYTNCGTGDILKGDVKNSQFTFTDLTPAWEYDAKIVAYNGAGEASAVYRICAAPAPTGNLKASVDNNTITATWDVQASHGYYIQWSTDETFTKNVSGAFINGSGSTSYTINVANAQDYYVRVRAWKWYQDSRLYSDFCEPVKPSIALTAPTGFNVYARGDGGTDLYLDWDDVAGADGYRVYTNCGPGDVFEGETKDSQFTFTDLTPAWEYDAKVVAYNETGEVSAVYRICAAPAPTDSLKASATGNTITATWVEQASHGYYIQWSTDETFTNNVSGTFINGSASTSYTINVANAQDYYVRVRAWKWYQSSRLYSDFCEPVKP